MEFLRALQELATSEPELEEAHTNSKITCTWYKDEFYGASSSKKSVSAGMFILFLGYTMFVLMRQTKKDTSVSTTPLFDPV